MTDADPELGVGEGAVGAGPLQAVTSVARKNWIETARIQLFRSMGHLRKLPPNRGASVTNDPQSVCIIVGWDVRFAPRSMPTSDPHASLYP